MIRISDVNETFFVKTKTNTFIFSETKTKPFLFQDQDFSCSIKQNTAKQSTYGMKIK